MHPIEGSDMHPHTPQDRRAFESPDFAPTQPESDRDMMAPGQRSTLWPMIVAALVLAAIVALVVLL